MASFRHQGFRNSFCGRSCGKRLTVCTAQCTSALPDKCGPCSSGLQNLTLQQGPADPPSSQNPRSVEGLNLSPTKSQGCDSSVHIRSLAGICECFWELEFAAGLFMAPTPVCTWTFENQPISMLTLKKGIYVVFVP